MRTNLLRNRSVSGFLHSGMYPAVFQAITAGVFVIILYQLILGPDSAHDNLGTALTWVLWWPLIPIIFLVLGRFWCAICPFGTLNDLVQKFVGNNRPVPIFLKKYGIWNIDALFILITWTDHVYGIVDSPWGSGVLLLGLTTGVVISGAFLQRRAFCRYLCFLGGLAGNYARAGMVALRATPGICAACNSRAACYNGNEKGAGCPMFEFPRQMESNAECNLCANCVKTCPNDSIQITVRPPTKELWTIRKPRFEEAFLAIVIMGIVFVQNVTMLEVWQGILQQLQSVIGTDNYAVNFTVTFLVAMAIPVGLFALAALIARRFNRESILTNFTKFGYAIIPLDIAGHIAHNLFHLLAEGKSVAFTALQALGQTPDTTSAALVSMPTIQVLQYALIVLGALASMYAVYAIGKSQNGLRNSWGSFSSYSVLIGIFFLINTGLFALPMSMRMHGGGGHNAGGTSTDHMDHHQSPHGGQLQMGDNWHLKFVPDQPGTYRFYLYDPSGQPVFPQDAQVQMSLIDASGAKSETLVAQQSANGDHLIAKGYAGNVTTDSVRVTASMLGSKPVDLIFKLPLRVNTDLPRFGAGSASAMASTPTPVPAGSEARIILGDNYFYPERIVIQVGATVRWDHGGSGGPHHNIVALDDSWGTRVFGVGNTFKMTFTAEGVYPYVCVEHEPGMRGEVIVVR